MKSQVFGRAEELAVLTRALDGAAGMVLIRGEAGIGKSALAGHLTDLAADRGVTVLRGQAHPLHAGLAYAPIVQAVRPHVTAFTDSDGLATLLGNPLDPAMATDTALARTQMFEAVTRLAERLAPAVFFVDDLHWADRGTIELVHYLGRNATGVLALGAYRPGEANPSLDQAAVTARRAGAEVDLGPLADKDVAAIAAALLGEPPHPEFLRDVTRRAKGVPLFVTALVRGGLQTDAAVPTIVRDVVLGRLRRLGEPERRLIEVVAVAGEAATESVLSRVADEPDVVRRLVLDGLLDERPLGRTMTYRVAHPLYAEVAYAEMTIGERRRLHAAVLSAVEQDSPGDVLTLAPHYREAGDLADPARAAAVLAEAGWRALAMRATDEAIRYLNAAMETAGPQQQAELLDGIGRAHMAGGDLDSAADCWERGIAVAYRHELATPLVNLRFRLAMLESERQDSAMADEQLWPKVRAVSLDSPELAIQTFIYTLRHGSLEAARDLSEALKKTTSEDNPAAMRAVSHFAQAIRFVIDKEFAPALHHCEQAVAHARGCADESPFYAQYFQLVLSAFYTLNGDVQLARGCAQDIVRAGSLVELPSLMCFEHYVSSFSHYLAGDLTAALDTVAVGLTVAEASGMPRSIARLRALRAFLLAERGDLRGAAAALADAKAAFRSLDHSLVELSGLANHAIALYTGEPAEPVLSSDSQVYSDPCATVLRLMYTGLAALDHADPDTAIVCATALRGFTSPPRLMIRAADRLDGLRTRDADLLADTARAFDSMGTELLAAHTWLEHAELTRSVADVPRLVEVFDKTGATHWANRARRLARASGIRLRPGPGGGPLTGRETDVVRLLGEGLSNADIAARLFLSGRTVESHLRNSYAKLGLGTRVALARWASENLS
nr:LuxR family transcriptional regulator [Kibdelosporangium sp. MJ126-NF4]